MTDTATAVLAQMIKAPWCFASEDIGAALAAVVAERDALAVALQQVLHHCRNTGRGSDMVDARIVERCEDTAAAALQGSLTKVERDALAAALTTIGAKIIAAVAAPQGFTEYGNYGENNPPLAPMGEDWGSIIAAMAKP